MTSVAGREQKERLLDEIIERVREETNGDQVAIIKALYAADDDVPRLDPHRPKFVEVEQFPFLHEIQQNWEIIRDEYYQLRNSGHIHTFEASTQMVEKQDEGWKAFELYYFSAQLPENQRLCPKTTELLERVPGVNAGLFSILDPGAHIMPHEADYEGGYRAHLGLECPDNCGFKVGGEVREWEDGKFLIFDYTHEHSAWNHSDRSRAIFFLDFWHPRFTQIPLAYEKAHEVVRINCIANRVHLASEARSEEARARLLSEVRQLNASLPEHKRAQL